jgi:hypothetical protein
MPSLHRDSFAAKVPGPCPVLASGNTPLLQTGFSLKLPTGQFLPYCRAVRFNFRLTGTNSNQRLKVNLTNCCPDSNFALCLIFTAMESSILSEKTGNLEFITKKEKRIFFISNLLLIFGVFLIVSTLLYLLFNLNHSDKVIYKCIFTIISGLVLVFFYVIGFNTIKNKKGSRRQYF